jgi:hypothetical protein
MCYCRAGDLGIHAAIIRSCTEIRPECSSPFAHRPSAVIGASPEANHTTPRYIFTMPLNTEVAASTVGGPGHRVSDTVFHAG